MTQEQKDYNKVVSSLQTEIQNNLSLQSTINNFSSNLTNIIYNILDFRDNIYRDPKTQQDTQYTSLIVAYYNLLMQIKIELFNNNLVTFMDNNSTLRYSSNLLSDTLTFIFGNSMYNWVASNFIPDIKNLAVSIEVQGDLKTLLEFILNLLALSFYTQTGFFPSGMVNKYSDITKSASDLIPTVTSSSDNFWGLPENLAPLIQTIIQNYYGSSYNMTVTDMTPPHSIDFLPTTQSSYPPTNPTYFIGNTAGYDSSPININLYGGSGANTELSSIQDKTFAFGASYLGISELIINPSQTSFELGLTSSNVGFFFYPNTLYTGTSGLLPLPNLATTVVFSEGIQQIQAQFVSLYDNIGTSDIKTFLFGNSTSINQLNTNCWAYNLLNAIKNCDTYFTDTYSSLINIDNPEYPSALYPGLFNDLSSLSLPKISEISCFYPFGNSDNAITLPAMISELFSFFQVTIQELNALNQPPSSFSSYTDYIEAYLFPGQILPSTTQSVATSIFIQMFNIVLLPFIQAFANALRSGLNMLFSRTSGVIASYYQAQASIVLSNSNYTSLLHKVNNMLPSQTSKILPPVSVSSNKLLKTQSPDGIIGLAYDFYVTLGWGSVLNLKNIYIYRKIVNSLLDVDFNPSLSTLIAEIQNPSSNFYTDTSIFGAVTNTNPITSGSLYSYKIVAETNDITSNKSFFSKDDLFLINDNKLSINYISSTLKTVIKNQVSTSYLYLEYSPLSGQNLSIVKSSQILMVCGTQVGVYTVNKTVQVSSSVTGLYLEYTMGVNPSTILGSPIYFAYLMGSSLLTT